MKEAILQYSESFYHPSMYYATRYLSMNDYFYIQVGEKTFIIVHDIESEQARQFSNVETVLSYSDLKLPAILRRSKNGIDGLMTMLFQFLKKLRVSKVIIPKDFPAYVAFSIQKHGIQIRVDPTYFQKLRIVKKDPEIKAIKISQEAASYALKNVEHILSNATVQNDILHWEKEPLTTTRLHHLIDTFLLEMNCYSAYIIISCGKQSALPHLFAQGVLKINEPILIDLFPIHKQLRYHGDMSRTYVRGKPNPMILQYFQWVMEAREVAFSYCKPGQPTKDIHDAVCQFFSKHDIPTINDVYLSGTKIPYGFLHDVGHGIGLDIHEAPFVSFHSKYQLEPNQVITIEPGLYHPEVGGVRIEDAIAITSNGYVLLAEHPVQFLLE